MFFPALSPDSVDNRITATGSFRLRSHRAHRIPSMPAIVFPILPLAVLPHPTPQNRMTPTQTMRCNFLILLGKDSGSGTFQGQGRHGGGANNRWLATRRHSRG
ncbi:hypothetical protein POVCU1_025260 [Plasmodium ovale curtisi]|uniref:Uncharacterized protein n=1 Tax=Plasmodium ovale curtisi TaxID=864141 RepID=A0A1A8WM78_PLAOA|nr:hypothetical protein POVCU1_025260 [Plasmodium ovale curtisi]